ncbi:hypothetical protein NNQ28_13750 [Cronobacter dublinensis]|uniref:hypothetical protein n=1 Tax=Cronobacter dublinensis TaxID=413497 RepID=UPI00292D5D40|nr:hypothetical protein [Cronobacter dublinensis]WNY81407.1 hypothetical protein NNQ28_13750 [Cronobacter dublinensis]
MLKDQTVDLGNNVRLEFNIPKNSPLYGNHDNVLATYLIDKDMDIVDSVQYINSIVFLPWSEEEGKRWLSTWKPEIAGPFTWKILKPELPDPIGNEILRLDRCINMSTELSHPSDKDRAKRIFADLKKQGLKASEEAVRQFAVNNGWDPVRAQELASFAKKYVG